MKKNKVLNELVFINWSQFERVDYDADPADLDVIRRSLEMDYDYETEKEGWTI